MNEKNQQNSDEKRLWRLFAAKDQSQPVLSDLDPNLLAAYLDGNANTTQVEQIESLMASDPALLDELIELRQLQNAGPALVQPAFLDQLKALKPAQPATVALRQTGAWQRFHWAAAAAAVVFACVGGYSVGQTTFQDRNAAQTSITSQASLEMDGFTLALVLQPNGSNGGAK